MQRQTEISRVMEGRGQTDKKNKIFLIYKEIQEGRSCKVIYSMSHTVYEEAVSYI
jgi:hypothetical protein